ncbi:MAG: Gfo/Idh/MocA family oxidoreductase, partial [Verrucomicrobiota bacterium]
MSKTVQRRKFLKQAAAGVAGSALIPQSAWSQPQGANESIRVAVLGTGGKGSDHINRFQRLEGVEVVAICDADADRIEGNSAKFSKAYKGKKVDTYQDYRKVLDRDDIDAVVIATPNHWHTTMAVHACQAGKHVYVEKPSSHNIWEGPRLTEAAKKYGRVVQTGTQRRSDPGWHEAMQYLRSGALGKVEVSRGLCYKRRKSIGKVAMPAPIADSVNYDLWSGPAEIQPVMRERFHYDWHWIWDYGNGDLGNQGVHQTDVARWALGANSLPRRVVSVGGRFGYEDDGETANSQFAIFEYDEGKLIFEVRGLGMKKDMDARPVYKVDRKHSAGITVGNVVHCEYGYIAESGAYDHEGRRLKKFGFTGGGEHQANFIEAVRKGDPEAVSCPPEDGHLSSAICHLANISHRLGSAGAPEAISERFEGDAAAQATFESFKDHLAANEIDVKKVQPTLGPVL